MRHQHPMNVEWTLVTGPAVEPITVGEAKLHAHIVQTAEDALIRSYIAAARQAAEDYMQRGLFTQTWKAVFDQFAESMWLPMAAPLQGVTTVQYYDSFGVLQTLASTYYDVDTVCRPGRITRAANQFFPATHPDRQAGRVIVTYDVGWSSTADIPERIKQGIRMYVSYLEADREGMAPEANAARQAAESCWTDRVEWIPPRDTFASSRLWNVGGWF